MKPILLPSVVVLNLLAVVSRSSAYNYWDTPAPKWPSSEIVMHAANDGDQFDSGSEYRTALDTAAAAWNLNPGNIRFKIEYDTTSSAVGTDTDVSEIWFTDDEDMLGGFSAIAYVWWNSSDELTEADILFDANEDWTTSSVKTDTYAYGGDGHSFQNVALHEMGHALGLDHEDGEYNIMGQDWNHMHVNGNKIPSFYPGEDASDGAADLYGPSADAPEDLGVVHWQYSGTDGEYSTHERTKIYDESGGELDYYYDSNDEPVFKVDPGQTVQVVVAVENNGTSNQKARLSYYYSVNSLVTTSDTNLGDFDVTVSRNKVFMVTNAVVIPTWAHSGNTRYLGAIVDSDHKITESVKRNNGTYIGIYVK